MDDIQTHFHLPNKRVYCTQKGQFKLLIQIAPPGGNKLINVMSNLPYFWRYCTAVRKAVHTTPWQKTFKGESQHNLKILNLHRVSRVSTPVVLGGGGKAPWNWQPRANNPVVLGAKHPETGSQGPAPLWRYWGQSTLKLVVKVSAPLLGVLEESAQKRWRVLNASDYLQGHF